MLQQAYSLSLHEEFTLRPLLASDAAAHGMRESHKTDLRSQHKYRTHQDYADRPPVTEVIVLNTHGGDWPQGNSVHWQ